jgi:Squalene-hopene cyclase C-terminal domain
MTVFRASVAGVVAVAILLLVGGAFRSAEPAAKSSPEVQRAVERALPLLLKGAEGHVAQRTCFACHNQGVPLLAFTTALAHGFAVRESDLKRQVDFIADFLARNQDNYREGKGQGGQADTAGYALLALEVAGWKADANTEAVVEYLLQRDRDADHWRASGNRPPSEGSQFTVTYLALRGLHHWGTKEQRERIEKRTAAVRGWLLGAKVSDTEDRVFRLWALREAGAEDGEVRRAAEDLLRGRREDGGWGQTDALDSDAYATGLALVGLHLAAGVATDDPAYQRGVAFLLKGQKEDGSWLVHSRSKPFQTY